MEELVRGLISFQKDFQMKMLEKMEKQNQLIQRQNFVLEKLHEKLTNDTITYMEEPPTEDQQEQSQEDEEVDLYESYHEEIVEEARSPTLIKPKTIKVKYLAIDRDSSKNMKREREEEEPEFVVGDEEDEIVQTSREIEMENKESNADTVIFPISDINTLFEIDEESQVNPEFEEYLEEKFVEAIPTDDVRFTNVGLHRIFTDDVMAMINWNGEQNKIRMSGLRIFKTTLQRAWSSKYKTEEEFVTVIKRHLKAAKRRLHTYNCRRRSMINKKEESSKLE